MRRKKRKGWYVSHLGEIRHTYNDPGQGWSRLTDPDKLPDNYHPENGDVWAHGVVSPEGESLIVPLIVADGEWRRSGDVMYLEDFMVQQMEQNVGSIIGVGNHEGIPAPQEKYYEKRCIACGCTEENPCIDENGQPCTWAKTDVPPIVTGSMPLNLCTHCVEVRVAE